MKSSRMSSQSEQDSGSESSSSPLYMASPQGSPAQQVPQLINYNAPYLRIIEQPQNQFRFRYISEMVGTHGCLLGKSYNETKTKEKTHPTVELVNYTGRAVIRCQLAQDQNFNEHPHKLQEDEQDRDVSYQVPDQGSYKVGFAGMGIIHTAKKDVAGLLFKQRVTDTMTNEDLRKVGCKLVRCILSFDNTVDASLFQRTHAICLSCACNLVDIPCHPTGTQQCEQCYLALRIQCDAEAKAINLNIVRLKFSAYDPDSRKPICPPVFSENIHNMKSAATNDLKICRISRTSGRPAGGDDVYIFVEKVNKKNIQIRFFEEDQFGTRTWTGYGQFMQADVHHQYAIVFRTPPYVNINTPKDVLVHIELLRPSDGRTSEPKPFKYRAEPIHRMIKKRKTDSSYSSIESVSEKSTVVPESLLDKHGDDYMEGFTAVPSVIPQVPTPLSSPIHGKLNTGFNPMLGSPPVNNPSVTSLEDLKLNSAEFANLLLAETNLAPDDVNNISNSAMLPDYLASLGLENPYAMTDNGYDDLGIGDTTMSFIHLRPDSGRGKVKNEQHSPSGSKASNETRSSDDATQMSKTEYPAYFKAEDGMEVKELLKDLVEMMRSKKAYRKQDVRNKLERLFEIRLSNGDTFLHMTLFSNAQSFEYIVRLIHSGKMQHLFESANHKQQTILHLAIANNMPAMVALLVAKGCSPMTKDHEEHTAVHYAVRHQCCLDTLLDAVHRHDVPCDLNDTNGEKQTALHLAVVVGSASATSLLLRHGASYCVRDAEGRTPLHLAAYDDRLDVARALLEHMSPSDVDVTDGRGNTALQIVCGGSLRTHTVEMTKLLLMKNADPQKHEEHNESAWLLARHKPALRDAMRALGMQLDYEDDVKSEPDDDYEYESADEGDDCGLVELGSYCRELSARLDASGAWREVAARVCLDSLASWFGAQPSPTYTLLNHLKESREDISSKSLVLILDDVGEKEAAQIVRKYI